MTADRERLRRRLLAIAGLWLLLAGLLAALGLIVVVLIGFVVTLVIGLAVAALMLLRSQPVKSGLQSGGASTERVFRATRGRLHDVAVGLKPPPPDPRRRAARLNELGVQLRRARKYERAVEQHRAALAIVRDLGDRPLEALTLNNLALALAHAGAVTPALQRFEQALVVLRELGDDEHEGRVIANLAFVHGRQGHNEEAVDLLQAALDKLPPESSAYRQVEEQLRRAS